MRNLKKIVALLLVAAMALGLIACSKGGNNPSGEEQIEITITHWNIEEQRDRSADYDGFWEMLEIWQKDHPEVKITHTILANADLETKIQAQAAVDDLPDLFVMKGSWYKNFVASDLLSPLDDAMAAYDKKDTFRPGILDTSTVDGHLYGLPVQLSASSFVYYNAPMWAEIGYETFPTTWDEFYDAVAKFNEKGITPVAFGNKDKWPAESCILSTLGDRYTGTEWINSLIENDGKSKWTDPQFIAALEQLQNMVANNAFNPDFNTLPDQQATESYNNGNAAATITGFWDMANIIANGTEEVRENTKIALLPSADGGLGVANATSGGSGTSMAMSKQDDPKKKALIEDLLFTLAGYEYSEFLAQKYGIGTPCVVPSVDASSFPTLTQEYIKVMETTELTPIYDITLDPAVIETMNSGLQELLNGSKDAATLAAEIQAEQDKVGK